MVDGHLFSTLALLYKRHYLEAVEHTIAQTALYWDKLGKAKGVKLSQKGGGRRFEFPYEVARGMNFMSGDEDVFLPGQSGYTNDDLDPVSAVEAFFNEKRAYSAAKFDGYFKADAHGSYTFHEGANFQRNIRQMVEDIRWNLQRELLSDGTGQLAEVVSDSTAGGVTTVVVKSARVADDRGLTGTARLRQNQKIVLVKAANWANNPHEAVADLFGGNKFLKIASVSKEYDVSATPSFTVTGDETAEFAAGDIVVLANSRTMSDGGGNGTSGTDATREFNGLLAMYDDGTLRDKHLGLTRSSYASLNAQVDTSATLREPTPELFQGKIDDLNRRMGDDHDSSGYEMLSEHSVRTRYASRLGEEAKRYIQDNMAKVAVGGFKGITMAFLGNDKLVPWRVCRDMPYGQVLYHDPTNLEAFWSREVAPMDDDGLTIRQVSGKDMWAIFYKMYGEIICKTPWKGVRWNNIQGHFA